MQHLKMSSREADVLREFFYDDRTAAIAAALRVSPHTVQTYRDRLFRRLQVGTSSQAIARVFAEYLRMLHMEPTVPSERDAR